MIIQSRKKHLTDELGSVIFNAVRISDVDCVMSMTALHSIAVAL